MRNVGIAAAFGLTLASLAGTPASAQSRPSTGEAELRGEIEALKAQIRALEARLDQMSTRETQTAAAPPPKPESDPVRLSFKGAPEFGTDSGWSFKPRGRVHVDAGYLEAPPSPPTALNDSRGLTTELRRAYIGASGTIPGGFGYKAEVDLADNDVEWTDAYLTYDDGPLNLTVGQHYPFFGIEQQTSDNFISFAERAAFTSAFNYERKIGVSGGYAGQWYLVNAGIFTDNIADLTIDRNRVFGVDGRLVLMPVIGNTQLHLGASAHWRDLNPVRGDFRLQTRYRARPYIHSTDLRFVDTQTQLVAREANYGLEFAAINGPFHVAAEGAWLRASRVVGPRLDFFGGYAEVGYFLTRGDVRPYSGGSFERVKPRKPVGKDGGAGAIQVNLRYDYLDLSDEEIFGGVQSAYGVSLVWTTNDYVRFILNYLHLDYDDLGRQPDFNADVVGMRAQVDF